MTKFSDVFYLRFLGKFQPNLAQIVHSKSYTLRRIDGFRLNSEEIPRKSQLFSC